MGRQVLKVTGYTPQTIQSLFRDDERYTIGIRLYAVYQVACGQSSRKLEELYNTSFKQITNWVHQFEREGISGLRNKARKGRNPKLTEEQRKLVKDVLENHSPTEYGYNTATWTGPLLIAWIKKNFDVIYKKAQIYNIIHGLGFSYQKGKGIYPEANKQNQAAFKEALKKTAGRKP
jgi:transposase